MPKLKLTARNVLTLEAGAGGARATYRDAVLPGLELRVSGSGSRTFRVRYGAEGDRAVTLGDARVLALSDARDKARGVLGRVAHGDDPAAERAAARRVRAASGETVEALGERLVGKVGDPDSAGEVDLAVSTRRSWKGTLGLLVYPVLGDRAPASITRGDVRELVERTLVQHGASQAAEALKVLRWLLARAVDLDLIPANPAAGVKKPGKELPRDRVLALAELRGLWNAAGEAGAYGQAVRFAMLSGARRGEVFAATWAEVDREAEVWRLPSARTKNRRPHTVPLTRTMLDLLGDQGEAAARIFPVAPASDCWRELLEAAGIVTPPLDGAGGAKPGKRPPKRTRADRWPIRFHDLRRTFRNALTAELGVMPHVAEALVGHAESKLVRTYAPSGVPLAERRKALERWGRYVAAIASGKPASKVAAFRP
jgi:integrase